MTSEPQFPSDYSYVTTRSHADALVNDGELVKFYLYPARFGGTEEERDSRFIPTWVAEEKAKFDAMVSERYDDGRLTGYMCRPTDWNDSLVPTSLKLIALKAGSPVFISEIEIWQP